MPQSDHREKPALGAAEAEEPKAVEDAQQIVGQPPMAMVARTDSDAAGLSPQAKSPSSQDEERNGDLAQGDEPSLDSQRCAQADEEDEWEEEEWEDEEGYHWPEYIGETKRRSRRLALLGTVLCPGFGYVYLGRFALGMMINLFFLISLSGLILSWGVMKYFPMAPLLVFVLGWLIIVGVVAINLLHEIERERPYVLRPSNHPLVYGTVILFTFWLPMILTLGWSMEHVWQRAWVGGEAMAPSFSQGDLVLVDKTAYLHMLPRRGDLVMVAEPSEDGELVYFARVVGVGGDRVHMEGSLPWVNGVQLQQRMWEGEGSCPAGLKLCQMAVELPYGVKVEGEAEPSRWYMVLLPDRPRVVPTERVELAEDELFLLNDNRLAGFGEVERRLGGRVAKLEWLEGRPLYVLYSRNADTGEVRWERMGLRLR